ncbi:MAG: fructose-6-phosphate aldolase [Planctomycetota bacterium]|jgi:transaldolase
MKFFLDTADAGEIRRVAEMGLLDGVTTNPSLVAKTGRKFEDAIREICEICRGPVSAECVAETCEGMVPEARALAKIADNIAVKIPLTRDGIRACKIVSGEGIRVNVTLCFSANQALLAAKAGAAFVSPFVGRIDDVGQEGMHLIREIVQIYSNYEFPTEVISASIRHPQHVLESALAGAHIATIPAKVFDQMFRHPLTDAGVKKFLEDHRKIPK